MRDGGMRALTYCQPSSRVSLFVTHAAPVLAEPSPRPVAAAGRSTSPSRCPSGMDWCPLWFPLRLPRPAPSHPPPAGVAARGGRASTSPASRVRALRPRRAWPSAADAPSPRSRCSARRVRCPRCFGCGRSAPSKSRPRRTRPARCGRRANGRQGTVVAACEVRGGARVGPMERYIHTRTRTHGTRTRTRGNGVDFTQGKSSNYV